ncbi:MAG: SPFH domain-containing protein [Corynebacterium sp.]|nr:SPFH domain-containing protein [Corynebacterium sp.]
MLATLVPLVIIIAAVLASIIIVKQQNVYIIERFGRFNRLADSGLRFRIPVIENVAHVVELRIRQLDLTIESKTKDNVFVTIPVSVQFKVSDPYKSYYSLEAPEAQISAYVLDKVRSALSQLNLDEAFEAKEQIAQSVETALIKEMTDYGFTIVNTLVTDINPDPTVRASMNEINAAQRKRDAAVSLAEAEKIRLVTEAQGQAEAKRLQGEGIAQQRKAIVDGLVDQYTSLRDAGVGDAAQEMLLMTQYFDTLESVAKSSTTKTLFLPSNPGGFEQFIDQIRDSIVAATETGGTTV